VRAKRVISVVVIAVICSLVLLPSFFLVYTSSAQADLPVDAQTASDSAYQSVPFDYFVTITNNENESLHITLITFTIFWPDEPIFHQPIDENNTYFTRPTETNTIFSGDQVIQPGNNYTFKQSINTGFFGYFQTEVQITGRSDSDPSPSTKTISSWMSFGSASEAPRSPIDVLPWFLILSIIFFGICWIGFQWGKVWWSHEIENAMNNEYPDDLLWWKWHPYFWERDGKMWWNYVMWGIASVLLTLYIVH
jgi:hypothetical protein